MGFCDGNTSTLQNPIHQFNSRGVYNVSLNVHNNMTGCSHTFSKLVTITIPQAHFDYLINASNSYADSLGCKPHQAHLVNNFKIVLIIKLFGQMDILVMVEQII